MHTIYTAADPLEAEILRSYLEAHGIVAQILGAALWGGRGELPVDGGPRLVVDDAKRVDDARELLRRYEHRRHSHASWRCRCGEESPVHFEVCWACAADRPAGCGPT